MLKLHLKIYGIIITVFLLPLISFAQVQTVSCSKDGYTIETINGIFTKEGAPNGFNGAVGNRNSLKRHMGDITVFNGEPLTFDYLYNPTHGPFGLIDLTDTAIQKTFEGVDMQDPDFLKILNAASTQVKTQKVLIVAHSQGNFYANNLYETVTKSGDVSQKSIGVYSVATPASYVAGNGIYRTSNTDTVINRARKALPGTFLPAHDSVNYKMSDDSGRGHGFREIYLEYRGEEIKREIEESLGKLSIDTARSEGTLCINPPKALSTIEKVTNTVVYPVDATISVGAVALTARKNAIIDFAISSLKKDIPVAIGTYNGVVNTAVWSYNTTVFVAVWSYDATVAIGKFVGNTTVAVASTMYNAVAGALSNTAVAGSNSAAVILATMPTQAQKSTLAKNQVATVTNPVIQPLTVSNSSVTTTPPPQTVFVFEPKVQGDTSAPKLVFVGSFGGGGGAPTLQVLGTQSTASVVEEVVVVGGGGAGDVLTAPTLSAPQCAQTLATDGCLLATTTVHFEWAPVSGASYYATIKNGAYATTTETALDISVRDFSDYALEVVAVGTDGTASATSTQAVSVATIPIAINEIAWMGTKASYTDEWFEIKNNTSRTIDLAQWKLNAKDGAPHIALKGTIAPRAYIIFERTNDETVKDILAHATTTGSLNDKGDQLTLFRDSVIFDQTPAGAWVAGATSTKQTMERYSSRESGTDLSNWGTNLGYIKNGIDATGNAINGTPGAQNSVSTLINKGQDITSDFTLTADEERYVVPSQILIDASSTLTIEPGVIIQFYHGGLWVNGVIDARGTAENPIIFDSFSTARAGDFWIDNSIGTSTFEYARFENMNNVFVVTGGVLEIRDSEFVNTDGGVYANGANSTVLIENTNFASSTSDTIVVDNGGTAHIASSTITNQLYGDAAGLYSGSSFFMSSSTIDGVHAGSGINASDSFVSIASSTVRNTEGTAISLTNSTTTIANTAVQGGALNDKDGTSGISIDGGVATITDTTVTDFTEGTGIAVSLQREEAPPYRIVHGIVADISNTEIARNATGIEMEVGSASIAPDVSVHNNTKNIVVCQTDGECVEQ